MLSNYTWRLQLSIWLSLPGWIFLSIQAPLNAQETETATPAEAPHTQTRELIPPPEEPQPIPEEKGLVEAITEERIAELFNRYPAPSGDQPASSEYNLLLSAQSDLRSQGNWEAQLKELQSNIQNAPHRIETVKTDMEDLETVEPLEIPTVSGEVQSLLDTLKTQLNSSKSTLKEANDSISSAPQRRLSSIDRVNELEPLIRELGNKVAANDAEAAANGARLQNYQAELKYIRLILSSADIQRNLDAIIRDYETRRGALLQERIDRVSSELAILREADLRRQEEEARKAQRMAAMQDPALKDLADYIQFLTTQRRELDARNSTTSDTLNEYTLQAAEIQNILDTLEKRLSISGRSPSVGALIQRQMLMLPDFADLDRTRKDISQGIKALQGELLELELTLSSNPIYDDPGLAAIANPPADKAGSFSALIAKETLNELIAQRNNLLEDLISDSNRYFESLVAIDTSIKETIQSVQDFQDFAIIHSLWIPDRSIISPREVVLLPGFLGGIADEFMGLVVETVTDSMIRFLLACLGTIFVFALFYWVGPKLNNMRNNTMSEFKLTHTLTPLVFEILVATTPVLVFGWFAWALDSPDLDSQLAQPLKRIILNMGEPTIIFILIYRLCLPNNLGIQQFNWPPFTCKLLLQAFNRYLIPAYVVFFIGGILYRLEISRGETSGSRLFYLIGIILSILAIHHIFHPKRGILSKPHIIRFLNVPWIKEAIHLVLVLWPSILAVLIVFGYMVGVAAFFGRTVQTLWVISLISVAGGVLIRYTRSERLRALRNWREKRHEDQAARFAGVGTAWRQIRDQGRDMSRILGISSFLIAFFLIWADTLPAFYTVSNRVILSGSDGAVLLTVGQLFRVLLCLIATTVLAVHLPRILQVLLFSRFKGITQGNRYAMSTLLSYGVVVIGVVWASVIAGIQWESVQWFLAAATVGLGFGLQEIFGNLFAGIIVLFERPVRVGDVVTINNTTGIVSRIRIRATTLRQWDRTELIVPNKDIITNQLVNWSFSDSVTRLTFSIKVGFDSEPEKVSEILRSAVAGHPEVSQNPAPFVVFNNIDDYALEFNIYAYLDSLDNRLGMKGELHKRILKALKDNNISIPYPTQIEYQMQPPPDMIETRPHQDRF